MATILFYATVVKEQILKLLVGSLQEDYLELHSAISFSNLCDFYPSKAVNVI